MRRRRIMFVIRDLDYGGAQRQLVTLARGLDKEKYAVTIVPFYDRGGLAPDLAAVSGIEVLPLQKRSRWDVLRMATSLVRVVSHVRPELIHGYLPLANELSLIAGRAAGAKVVWGIRSWLLDFQKLEPWIRAIVYAGRAASGAVDLFISNSWTGLNFHANFGYPRERMVVIPNGIDTARFAPDPAAGTALREQWNVGPSEKLVGMVARIHPEKGHDTFLRAAAKIAGRRSDVRFVCVGRGREAEQERLRHLGSSLGLSSRLIWAGARDDLPAVYNALDALVSASQRCEGFSNSIGEAMACGVPCIVSDDGDSARLVGDTGIVVKPGDVDAVADAIASVVRPGSRRRNETAVARIASEFSVAKLIESTSRAFDQLLC
jgi:glycosyltransferase involved in cell wall biosynthesis